MNIIQYLPKLANPVRWACYGAMMSLPISFAGFNVFLALALLFILFSQEFWQALSKLLIHPVVVVTCLLFLFLAVGTLYSSAPGHEGTNYLWRYKKLLIVPLLIPFFQESPHRYKAISLFSLATFLTVATSWSEYFHLTHISDPAHGDFSGDSVIYMHITQGYLFAMLVGLSLSLAYGTQNLIARLSWLAIGIMTVLNICLVMTGRTGKATLTILIIWASWEWLNKQSWGFKNKALIQLACIFCVVGGVILLAKNPSLSFGIIKTDIERAERYGDATSQGLRMQFAKTGFEIFLKSPWIGHGTGSIVTEQSISAKEAITPVGKIITVNLHNEYLMQAAQLGVIGIGLFVMWLLLAWFNSLNPEQGWQTIALRGVIVVFAFGCLFNSYLWDHIEGYTYVMLLGILTTLQDKKHMKRNKTL